MLVASLDGAAPADTIAMCGSGVTACHLLLAMDVAGLPGGTPVRGQLERMVA